MSDTTTTAAPETSTTSAPETSTTAAADEASDLPVFTSVTVAVDPDDGSDPHQNSVQVANDVSLTLSWETANATSVHIANLGDFGPSGSESLPTEDKVYSLIASNDDGVSSVPFPLEVHTHEPGEVVSQHVDVGAGEAAIVRFAASAKGEGLLRRRPGIPEDAGSELQLPPGDVAILFWEIGGTAGSITIDNGVGDVTAATAPDGIGSVEMVYDPGSATELLFTLTAGDETATLTLRSGVAVLDGPDPGAPFDGGNLLGIPGKAPKPPPFAPPDAGQAQSDPPASLIHAIEADFNGVDRFNGQCFSFKSDLSQDSDATRSPFYSVFIPSAVSASSQNVVHVFFSAGGVTDFSPQKPTPFLSNGVACHAMRDGADRSGFILVSVRGIRDGAQPLSAKNLAALLNAVGRGTNVDRLRLSAHSRGVQSLVASLKKKVLLGSGGDLIDPGIVERVVAFDEDDSGVSGFVKRAGIPVAKAFGYRINAAKWTFPKERTVDLRPISKSVLVLGYCRLADDAVRLKKALKKPMPANVAAVIEGIKIDDGVGSPRLPFTSELNSRPPSAGGINIFDYVQKLKPDGFKAARAAENALHNFVDGRNDLVQARRSIQGGIYQHHLFVSEYAHEVTELEPPGSP